MTEHHDHDDSDLSTFLALQSALAIEDAKKMPTTLELKHRAHALAERARDHSAALRRTERARRPSNIVSGAIREAIACLSRVDVLRWFGELTAQHPDLQCAHRELSSMSDEDLQSALEDALSLIERRG